MPTHMKKRRTVKRKVTKSHLSWKITWIVALVTVLFLGHLWQKDTIKRSLKKIHTNKRVIANLEDENKQLRAKITQLTSAGWIEQIARERLGLSDPDHEPILLGYSPAFEKENRALAADNSRKKFAQQEVQAKIAQLLSK